MIPRLTFEVIDNPKGMIDIINSFLTHSATGFDWSGIYSEVYPELGKLIGKTQSAKEIKKISKDFFMRLYHEKLKDMKKTAKDFQAEWNKDGKRLLDALSKVVEKEWPENCREIKAWVSLNPICPRFLEQRAFDIFWRFSMDEMKKICLHEILHFIWFEKWKEVFPKYKEKEFESPNLIWKLSEMVPFAILGDKRIQSIFRHKPEIYNEWEIKIKGKPLPEYIQEIYDRRKSFEDFMVKSWKFIRKHKREI